MLILHITSTSIKFKTSSYVRKKGVREQLLNVPLDTAIAHFGDGGRVGVSMAQNVD